jgi:lysyl-tRNA synthetase class 2
MPEEGRGREEEVLAARRESLERLRLKGVEPFALRYEPTARAGELRERFGGLGADVMTEDVASVAGRVVLRRSFGKLVFLVVRDATGDIQIVCSAESLDAASSELLDEIDLGDIVGASGRVMTTRRGELSVRAERLTMLTKSLRPLPEKWHGLRDPDQQQRRRHLQLATDPAARALVEARATVLRTIRRHLDERGFLEVETPVLQSVAGGALARPFTTYHNALDTELKLRISLELYLKRLLVGGLERVYEIGRNFRNEGIGPKYNPEFTMLEVYEAYGDYHSMMRLAEELVAASAIAVRGSLRVPFRGRDLDLAPPWRRITVLGSVSDAVGEEVTLDRHDLAEVAERHGVGVDPAWGPGKVVQELFEKLVEGDLFEPTFVCDFPREVSPLARPHREDPRLTEHFDLVIGGIELATAFSELTDPLEQRDKFERQAAARRAGDEEAHPLDEEFLRALEHGMPPAGGIGIGIDRLLIVLTDVDSIRDLILYPHVRPERPDPPGDAPGAEGLPDGPQA